MTCRVLPPLEALEGRLLLSLPSFATPLYDYYWAAPQNPLAVGVDGSDDPGTALTITAQSDNADVTVTVLPSTNHFAKLHFVSANGTAVGDVLVQLFDNYSGASGAVTRFITLSTQHVSSHGVISSTGSPFYTDVVVHRVIPDFMVQTGDAANGDGTGSSPLPNLTDPVVINDGLSFQGTGVLAFANTGYPNNSNSQFFITDAPYTGGNSGYIIFGQVVSGMDVVRQVISVPTNESDRPFDPPILQSVQILSGSSQDGTVVITPGAGFTGTANITITLDDGTQTTSKIITIADAATRDTLTGVRPTIDDMSDVTLGAVKSASFTVAITDDMSDTMLLETRTSYTGVNAAIDQVTQEVTVVASDDFDGVAKITVSAREADWGNLTPTEKTFYVISQPDGAAPIVSTRLVNPLGGSVTMAVQSGNLLLNLTNGLDIFDVSNPLAPVHEGYVALGGTGWDMQVVGNTVFVAAESAGLVAVSIADPAHPTILDSVAGDLGTYRYAVSVQVVGDRAYVADWGAGLSIYDVHDPANITRISSNNIIKAGTATRQGLALRAAAGVAVSGKYAYVTDAAGALAVFDVTNAASTKCLGYSVTASAPWGLSLVGDKLFVAESDGLSAYSLSSPSHPKKKSMLAMPGMPQYVAAVNQLAIVGFDRGFVLVDFSDLAHMQELGRWTAPGRGNQAGLDGEMVALPMGADQTVMVDATTLIDRLIVHKSLTFLDDQQVPVTVKVSRGTAIVNLSGAGTGSILSVTSPDVTAKTSITLSTPRGTTTTIHGASFDGDLKSFSAATAELDGAFSAVGTVGKLTLGDVNSGSTIDVGAPAFKGSLAVTLGSVQDLKMTSLTSLSKLTVTDWADSDAGFDLTAPSIGKLTVKGATGKAADFAADLQLTGAPGTAKTLNSVSIAHDLLGSTWDITGAVNSVKVTGTVAGSTLRADSFSSISVGAASGSDFLAGIALAMRRPSGHDDFADAAGFIKSFKVAGWRVPKGQAPPDLFVDSNVAAATIGSVTLKNVDYASGADAFGIWARTPDLVTAKPLGKVSCADSALVGAAIVTTKWTWPGQPMPQDNLDIQVL